MMTFLKRPTASELESALLKLMSESSSVSESSSSKLEDE